MFSGPLAGGVFAKFTFALYDGAHALKKLSFMIHFLP
jgi:hypothetical protein